MAIRITIITRRTIIEKKMETEVRLAGLLLFLATLLVLRLLPRHTGVIMGLVPDAACARASLDSLLSVFRLWQACTEAAQTSESKYSLENVDDGCANTAKKRLHAGGLLSRPRLGGFLCTACTSSRLCEASLPKKHTCGC